MLKGLISFIFLCLSVVPLGANSNYGTYLSALNARMNNDYKTAAQYYKGILLQEPDTIKILRDAVDTYLVLGDFKTAFNYAKHYQKISGHHDLGVFLSIFSDSIYRGDYRAAQAYLSSERENLPPIIFIVFEAWVEFALGNINQAVGMLDSQYLGIDSHILSELSAGLMYAMSGEYVSAERSFKRNDRQDYNITRTSLMAYVHILTALDETKKAVNLLEDYMYYNEDLEFKRLRDAILEHQHSEFYIQDPRHAIAEVFYLIAYTLKGQNELPMALLYGRIAFFLNNNQIDAKILISDILSHQKQYDLALRNYDGVFANHVRYFAVELERANILTDMDAYEEALQVLEKLNDQAPRFYASLVTRSQILIQLKRYEEAKFILEEALSYSKIETAKDFYLYYNLGILHDRMGDWPAAENAFMQALKIAPYDSSLLNYIGYSLVEKNMRLDDALSMIQQAFERDPKNGAIADSLGWVFFKLGQYEQAIEIMEIAINLMPNDPVINDHLGDVYWAVGRIREAYFQWNRALSFDPKETLAIHIKDKIINGLGDTTMLKE